MGTDRYRERPSCYADTLQLGKRKFRPASSTELRLNCVKGDAEPELSMEPASEGRRGQKSQQLLTEDEPETFGDGQSTELGTNHCEPNASAAMPSSGETAEVARG